MIVLDVWSGRHNLDHVARYFVEMEEGLRLTRLELYGGFLVNLRREVAWGGFVNFDNRMVK